MRIIQGRFVGRDYRPCWIVPDAVPAIRTFDDEKVPWHSWFVTQSCQELRQIIDFELSRFEQKAGFLRDIVQLAGSRKQRLFPFVCVPEMRIPGV